ncbi:recombinase family protein, partial [Methylobacterium sp. J-030]|nr:recombinase family protein [Methylobacterium sp. J-030]
GWPQLPARSWVRRELGRGDVTGTALGKPENLGDREGGQVGGSGRQDRRHEGRARDLAPVIAAGRAEGGVPLGQIAAALNAWGIPAARGGAWTATQVRRVS